MTILIACLVALTILLLWKAIRKVSRIASENTIRLAVALDNRVAISCTQSYRECKAEAEEIAKEEGVSFDGDIINLYEAVVKQHKYR